MSVTVNAVDANWNLVTSATPMVAITSSDANATLPANAALVAGTRTFSVTLKTAGSPHGHRDRCRRGTAVTAGHECRGHGQRRVPRPTSAWSPPASATAGTCDQRHRHRARTPTATPRPGTPGPSTSRAPTARPRCPRTRRSSPAPGPGPSASPCKTAGSRTVTATDTVSWAITGTSGSVTCHQCRRGRHRHHPRADIDRRQPDRDEHRDRHRHRPLRQPGRGRDRHHGHVG